LAATGAKERKARDGCKSMRQSSGELKGSKKSGTPGRAA